MRSLLGGFFRRSDIVFVVGVLNGNLLGVREGWGLVWVLGRGERGVIFGEL